MVLLADVYANTVPDFEQIRGLSGVVNFPYRATNLVAAEARTLYGRDSKERRRARCPKFCLFL